MPKTTASDCGDSLIEVLVALAILGIGVVALMAGLATQVSTSSQNHDQAQANSILADTAEFVKSQTFATLCATTSQQHPTTAQVPHDTAWTVSYGPTLDFDGQTACSASTTALAEVPIIVSGHGFNLTMNVVKRP